MEVNSRFKEVMKGKTLARSWSASLLVLLALGCGNEAQVTPANESSPEAPPSAPLSPSPSPSSSPAPSVELDELNQARPSLGAETFRDCRELQASVRQQLLLKQKSDQAADAYWEKQGPIEQAVAEEEAPAEEAQAASDSNAITNVQEAGVDEQDFVKLSDSSLYILRQNRIEVVDRKSLKPIGSLALADDFPIDPRAGSRQISPLKMYSDGERLIIIGQTQTKKLGPYWPYSTLTDYPSEPSLSPEKVKVLVFETRPRSLPRKVSEHNFIGDYVDSRFMAHHLYLVLRDQLHLTPGSLSGVVSDYPVVTQNNRVQDVSCAAIVKPKLPDLDFSLSKVVSLDTRKQDKSPSIVASLGASGQIYMSRKHIYTTKAGINWQPWTHPDSAPQKDIYSQHRDSLFIDQIAIDTESGQLKLQSQGAVKGYVRNQFHFKEYLDSGVLAVATTSYEADLRGGKYPGKVLGKGLNHLFILKPQGHKLEVVNGLYHYGKPGEDLRAVRFAGKYAYMVTFKKTDPLYAVDMSEPLRPRMLGELLIPGFSMYLHPVDENRLVGIGYDADDQGDFAWYQGIQVSLFDATDPLKLKRLDNKVHGQRGTYSDVTGDHHAFFFDKETKTFALPLVELGGKEAEGGWEYGYRLEFSGAVAYQVAGDSLVELGRVSHRDLMPEACLPLMSQGTWWEEAVNSFDINRLIKLDGRWVSISRFGLKLHDEKRKFGVMRTVAFKEEEKEFAACAAPVYYE